MAKVTLSGTEKVKCVVCTDKEGEDVFVQPEVLGEGIWQCPECMSQMFPAYKARRVKIEPLHYDPLKEDGFIRIRWKHGEQVDAYHALMWLLEPNPKVVGSGRTHVILEAILDTAEQNMGTPIPVFDHIPMLPHMVTRIIHLLGERCSERRLKWRMEGNNGFVATGRMKDE
jgi:hypothetical protein